MPSLIVNNKVFQPQPINKNIKISMKWSVVILGIFMIFAISAALIRPEWAYFIIVCAVIGALLFAGMAYFVFVYIQKDIRTKIQKDISKLNGFEYHQQTELPIANSILATRINSDHMEHVISGYVGDVPFMKSELSYIGPGEGEHEYFKQYILTCLTIYLDRPVPNVLITYTKNNDQDFDPIEGIDGVKLNIEGNFCNSHRILVPKNYERDALYFLTPELIDEIEQLIPFCDIEFIDNTVVIYFWGKLFSDKADFEMLGNIIEIIGGELRDNVKNYIDDRANDRQKWIRNRRNGTEIEPLRIAEEGAFLPRKPFVCDWDDPVNS